MTTATIARNADLEDFAKLLQDQQARKVDMVAPAKMLHMQDGVLHAQNRRTEIALEGVTSHDAEYTPTSIFDEGLAGKLGIPVKYLRRMRNEHVELYDANVNGWLQRDSNSYMVRAFEDSDGKGLARAFLSDSFKAIDHLDGLTATLSGIRDAGLSMDEISFEGCDLSERRMTVKIRSSKIAALAPKLLEHYRSPLGNIERVREVARREGQAYDPGTEPVVFAGLILSNSETGGGAFSITPRIVVQACMNGLMMGEDAFRSVHVGGKVEAGVVDWSHDTHLKGLELARAKTRDAVTQFLSPGYLVKAITRLEEQSDKPVDDAPKAIETVTKQLGFSDEHRAGLLNHFIRGGQTTAGGVMQAMTSYSQTLENPDVAHQFEVNAVKAMSLV